MKTWNDLVFCVRDLTYPKLPNAELRELLSASVDIYGKNEIPIEQIKNASAVIRSELDERSASKRHTQMLAVSFVAIAISLASLAISICSFVQSNKSLRISDSSGLRAIESQAPTK